MQKLGWYVIAGYRFKKINLADRGQLGIDYELSFLVDCGEVEI